MEKCLDTCLFCLKLLPTDLTGVDNPSRNRLMFDFLSNKLNVRWSNGSKFDKREPLPLCLKCQSLYEDCYQIQLQINELERLFKSYIKVVKGIIQESGRNSKSRKLGACGLNQLRESVLKSLPGSIKTETDAGEIEGEFPVKVEIYPGHEDEDILPFDNELEQEDYDFYEEDDVNDDDYLEQPRKRRVPPKKSCTGNSKKRKGSSETPTFNCHICDESLIGRTSLVRHYGEEHPHEKKYTCKFCGRYFSRHRDVEDHQARHIGVKRHECPECNKLFMTSKTMKDHLIFYHKGTGNRFKCETCGKECQSPSILLAHQSVHNNGQVFICKSCGMSSSSKGNFKRHNRRRHEGQAEFTVKNQTEMRGSTDEGTGPICHVCWKPIPERSNMKTHFGLCHQGQSHVTCVECGKKFKTQKDTRRHAMRHKEKTIQCDKCTKCFHTTEELKNHSKTHLPGAEKPRFVCDICGTSFGSKAALSFHYKGHQEEKTRWVCEICGKSYSAKKGYIYHQKRAHLNKTPHKCPHPDCSRAFTERAELEKHARVHTKVKPYKCPLCEKFFPYLSSRSRHVREVHHKNSRGQKEQKRLENVHEDLSLNIITVGSEIV